MTYEQYVLDVFAEHHNSMGLDEEEINDIISETPFSQLEKWLIKIGYDLQEYYL
jgi:ADP-dependent phosphofructokinase/glucokinase